MARVTTRARGSMFAARMPTLETASEV